MTYLPDVNVWVALTAGTHTHYGAAHRWLSAIQDEELVFCRITQIGLLRLLTNKHVMNEQWMSPDQAWQAYGDLREDDRISYMAEPQRLSETWESFTSGPLTSPNLWTDAYLCAFAHAARLTLVTFDAKMPVREGVSRILLSRDVIH